MLNNTHGNSLKDIVREEYRRCLNSPVYFMRKFCKIEHPTRGAIPFNLYSFQEETLTSFKNNRFNIVLKSRQMGISTLVAGYSLWLMTFFESKTVLVIATTQNTAKNLVTKVLFMHQNLPRWLRIQAKEQNKLSLKLANGSQVVAASSASDSARSYSTSLLVMDECAFIEKAEEIWTSAQPTLSAGGSAILLSTPNGIGGFFHKMWIEAEEGINGFNTICLKWNLHPERNQSWRDEMTRKLGEKDAAQECDCSFNSSGNSVIPIEILNYYKSTYLKDPVEKRWFDNNFWIFSYPDYTHQYIVSADVSRGDGDDFSAFHVLDIQTLEQVAEYKGKVPPKDFGNMLVSAASDYNNAILVVENANVGNTTIQQIIDRQYPNLFYSTNDLQVVDVQHQIVNKIAREERKMVAGFSTTSRTRPLIISKMDSYFREREIIIYSIRLIEELYTFIWKNGRPEAMKGYNDDLVMAFAIALWVRDTSFKIKTENENIQRMILDRISVSSDLIYTNQNIANDPYKIYINGVQEDISWLIK